MGEMGDLIGAQGAPAAGVVRPAEHVRLEEGAVDDQLPAALEQVEKTGAAVRPLEPVRLLHGHPWHAPALGGKSVTSAHMSLFLDEHALARGLPGLGRNDRWG
jgi:hypothetical protein